MTIFLILAPYAGFTSLMMVTSATVSLLASAGLFAAVIMCDAVRGRSTKILSTGSAVLFTALAGYIALCDPAMSGSAVKVAVDGGTFLLALGSMLAGTPFTLQYALESVPAETAAMPGFLRVNYVITAAWAVAMLLMMIGNIVLVYIPDLPFWTGLAIAFAARNSALYFTRWYPAYRVLKSEGRQAAGMVPLK
jgi:hypothetical protein